MLCLFLCVCLWMCAMLSLDTTLFCVAFWIWDNTYTSWYGYYLFSKFHFSTTILQCRFRFYFSIFFMAFAFSLPRLISSTSIRLAPFVSLSYWNVWTLQNKRLFVKRERERKKKKKNNIDLPSFQEIPWQNEMLPFVGKFSKATTTIVTANSDLTRCRHRLSAPNFRCLR